MSQVLHPDLCILGGGTAGASLAAQAAASGLSVALVEQRDIGGEKRTVLDPGHALLAATRLIAAIRRAGQFGIEAAEPHVHLERLRRSNAAVVAALARNTAEARLEALKVKIIFARGQFGGRDCLDAGGFEIKARHFVIATGASVKTSSIRGMDLIRPLTYESACGLKDVPPRLIVLGADPFGLALAQAFRRCGSGITVLAESKIFELVDDELGAPVRAELEREGIMIHEGVTVSRFEPRGEVFCVYLEGASAGPAGEARAFEGSHLLLATGGAPRVEGLGLAAADIAYDARGIAVDAAQRTTNRRVFAIGSVARGAHSGTAADSQASVALHALRGGPAARIPPAARLIMTDPAIAITGLSEAEARARHGAIQVLRWPFSETDNAHYLRARCGHVKIITTRGGRILGAGITGTGAGELINLCSLAISKGTTAVELAAMMPPYPALAEAIRGAAAGFCSGGGGTSLVQRLFRLSRQVG